MTVGECIKQLKKLPQDLPVHVEVHDCCGFGVAAGTVEEISSENWTFMHGDTCAVVVLYADEDDRLDG